MKFIFLEAPGAHPTKLARFSRLRSLFMTEQSICTLCSHSLWECEFNPLTLSCGHVICDPCLQNISSLFTENVNRVVCSTCLQGTAVLASGEIISEINIPAPKTPPTKGHSPHRSQGESGSRVGRRERRELSGSTSHKWIAECAIIAIAAIGLAILLHRGLAMASDVCASRCPFSPTQVLRWLDEYLPCACVLRLLFSCFAYLFCPRLPISSTSFDHFCS